MKFNKIVLLIFSVFSLLLLTYCDDANKKLDSKPTIEVVDTSSNKSVEINIQNKKRKTISDVINNTDKSKWLNISGDTLNQIYSAFLHFNLDSKEKLEVEFTPECWCSFPLIQNDSTIQIIWNPMIDTKYDFEIVQRIKKNLKKYEKKVFIILSLVNDTTLSAIYPYKSLIEELNKSDKDRVLFTKYFHLERR